MSKFTTESGDTINYKAKEITSEIKNFEVEIDTEFTKDTIIVTSTKENLEANILLKVEGKNNDFRTRNKKAKQERLDKEYQHIGGRSWWQWTWYILGWKYD